MKELKRQLEKELRHAKKKRKKERKKCNVMLASYWNGCASTLEYVLKLIEDTPKNTCGTCKHFVEDEGFCSGTGASCLSNQLCDYVSWWEKK